MKIQRVTDTHKFSEFETVQIIETDVDMNYTTWELVHTFDEDGGDIIALHDSMGSSYEDCRNDYLSYLNSIQG